MSVRSAFPLPLATALALDAERGTGTDSGERTGRRSGLRRGLILGAPAPYVMPRSATLLNGVDDDVLFDDGGAK